MNFDEVNAIAVNPLTNNGYITGVTASTAATFPVFPNPGAFQIALNGTSDAFIAELTFQPTLTVSPLTLTFGPQLVGTPTAAQMVMLTNNNITAVAFTSVAISGGSPAAANTDFTSPSNTCGTSIAAGASCTISVVFTPSVAAVETANLVITDADTSTSPQTVTLTGTGTNTAGGSLTVAPTTLAFGNQPVGTPTAAKMVTLTNSTNAAIPFTSALVIGRRPSRGQHRLHRHKYLRYEHRRQWLLHSQRDLQAVRCRRRDRQPRPHRRGFHQPSNRNPERYRHQHCGKFQPLSFTDHVDRRSGRKRHL